MSTESTTAARDPLFEEPARPGTSAKYLGGRPYYQYVVSFIIASVFLYSCYAAMAGILLPNSVQTIEFRHFFAGTSVQTINDVQALTDLKQARPPPPPTSSTSSTSWRSTTPRGPSRSP